MEDFDTEVRNIGRARAKAFFIKRLMVIAVVTLLVYVVFGNN